jgi:hypothetical protein
MKVKAAASPHRFTADETDATLFQIGVGAV